MSLGNCFSLNNIYVNRLWFTQLVFLFFFLTSPLGASGQEKKSKSIDEILLEQFGYDQILLNGRQYVNKYHLDKGHPFFLTDQLQDGTLVLHNKSYSGLKLMYNLYEENVVLVLGEGSSLTALLPPVDYISEFTIGNSHFKKIAIEDEVKFYEVVYDGKVAVLYDWYKKRSESDHASLMAFEYSMDKKKTYLFYDNQLFSYKSKGSFIKLFNPNQKKAIKDYIKKNKILFKTTSNQEMKKLLAFCEEYWINKPVKTKKD